MNNNFTMMMSASDLPFSHRARMAYNELWCICKAVDFCKTLLARPKVETITPEEYALAELVANGKPLPVPDRVYTHDDWQRDRSFHAMPGQEIEQSIYEQMFNVLPPYRLPKHPRTEGYTCGFQVSEPYGMNPDGPGMTYSTFGKKDGKYYFIGYLPRKYLEI